MGLPSLWGSTVGPVRLELMPFRLANGTALSLLLCLEKKLGRSQPEALGDPLEVVQGNVRLSTLYRSHVRAVHTALVSEGFLGVARVTAESANGPA